MLDDRSDGADRNGGTGCVPATIAAVFTFAVTSVIPVALTAVLIDGSGHVSAADCALDGTALGAFDRFTMGALDGLALRFSISKP